MSTTLVQRPGEGPIDLGLASLLVSRVGTGWGRDRSLRADTGPTRRQQAGDVGR